MIAMIFFASNCKKGFTFFDKEYQEIILGIALGIISKKETAKFFRNSLDQ